MDIKRRSDKKANRRFCNANRCFRNFILLDNRKLYRIYSLKDV